MTDMTLQQVVIPGQAVPDRVDDRVLHDLRTRLRASRSVPVAGRGWERGTDPGYLSDLIDYWADRYDWRVHEQRLRSLPWRYEAGIRLIHQRTATEEPPVVLLHGWPDSFFRFDRVLPELSDLDVLVPCLPGYPYADPVDDLDLSATTMADRIATAMAAMGYERFVVSGGDIGSNVAEQLAGRYPGRVAALHLTDVPWRHIIELDHAELTPTEQDFAERGQQWRFTEGAYALEQATKPTTLAVGLGDSPIGLAAWIVEKLRSWSDCGGDVESVFSRDDLLTWITLYWVTGTIGTSFLPYANAPEPADRPAGVPTVVTQFPRELVTAPRSFGERFFDIRVWDEEPAGGHFGAWERPAAYAAGVRQAVQLAR